jgi:hypothetical protein
LLANSARFAPGGRVEFEAIAALLEKHARFQRWEISQTELRDLFERVQPADLRSFIRSLYSYYAERLGKPRYGDKTPIFVVAIDILAEAFPDAVFVHVVRDGRNVALSRGSSGLWDRDSRFPMAHMGTEALRWAAHVNAGRASGDRLGPGRYLEVRYEDVVSDTERVVRKLCEFAKLEWDPSMLTYYERAPEIIGTVRDPHRHGNIARPPTKDIRTWREEMTKQEVKMYDATAGATLAKFGYPVGHFGMLDRGRAEAVKLRWRAKHLDDQFLNSLTL